MLPALMASTLQDAMDDLGILPHFILAAREHSHENAVYRLDACERLAKRLFHAGAVLDSSRGQNLEGEAGLGRLPHHAIHAGGIALHVDFIFHLHGLAVEDLSPFISR